MQRPIEVSSWIGAEFAHVGEVLADDPGAAFREAATAGAQQPTRTALSVDLGAGASVHQEVLVHLGAGQTRESGLRAPGGLAGHGQEATVPNLHRGAGSLARQTMAHGYGSTGPTPCRSV